MRDRDAEGRARNARARDGLGRPLPRGESGVTPLPEDLGTDPGTLVTLAGDLLDDNPFQAHEVLEAAWKAAPESQRRAWQGMAQLAVSVTHARRGNAEGAARLAARGRENLAGGELPRLAWDLRDRLLEVTAPAPR